MKIAIICAMEEELHSIVYKMNITDQQELTKGKFTIYSAEYFANKLYFILCGIGKVNAACATQHIIDVISPNYVVNVGVAGSLSPELQFGDVVIANDLIQHDVDASAFGLAIGQIPRMDVFSFASDRNLFQLAENITHDDYKITTGRITTGDQFIHKSEHAELIAQAFSAVACEMEGAAVAQTCYINQVPFIVVRALSDMAGRTDSATRSYEELKEMAADRASYVVRELLQLVVTAKPTNLK